MNEMFGVLATTMTLIVIALTFVVGGTLMEVSYNATQELVGVDTVPVYSVVTCGQDLPNESSSCGGLATGTINNASWDGLTAGTAAFDKNWITNSTDFVNATPKFITFTYTVPANITSATMEIKYDNATGTPTVTNATISGGTGCRNSTGSYAVRMNVTANDTFNIECINNSGVYAVIGMIAMPNESFQFFEQRMWWTINKSTSNLSVTNTLVDEIFLGSSTGITTMAAMLPIIVLAFIGGTAIMFLIHYFGRTQA